MMVNIMTKLCIAYSGKWSKGLAQSQVLDQDFTAGKQQSWDLKSDLSVRMTSILFSLKLQHTMS